MVKTYEEINEKIRNKTAVIVDAEEIIDIVKKEGLDKAAKKIDVVTTATFGPMCSSGAFLNVGHTNPRIKITKSWLNDVEAYAGIAAVDIFIGATQVVDNDPKNSDYPGKFKYGGGHVIEDLIAGKEIELKTYGYGTDCYPRKEFRKKITINDLNDAYLVNPRNCYQNYNVAINTTHKTIYTYMGKLKKECGNINYCSAGQLSPLLNDPLFKTIGVGTKIWLAGSQGHIYWNGTQHNVNPERTENDVPSEGAGTLAVTGDMKKMNSKYIRGVSLQGYGVSLSVGIGIPIPILNKEILKHTTVRDRDIYAPLIDYGAEYALNKTPKFRKVNYEELKSGSIELNGKQIPTSSLSSYPMAKKIATLLKKEIADGKFELTKPVKKLK